ncbi:uncharacterized protein TRIADDRAFT_58640 [Trichoplax adhaerens]|uniref:Sfi1 spindle body domain-containing protein n=1 Tax=Trichoplax adhaerens TaxID=10228 RepID=B3S394_TRIAD|nr:hypothetical protein TRIADDRAFT_58640 [Trichoplax adhaerens]EDV22931.1 hypothetical protein TRIADDRAFT_58640 [Trichoplax adhaerens]|eukprot:XP_002114797.1 hypothetical protein TRIADDRAFT_58640 [Trichoplax adhaerens]
MDKGNKLHAVSEPKSDPPKHEKDQPLSRKLETSRRLQGKPEKKKPQLVKRKSANEVKNVKVILQASTGGEKQLKSSLHTKAIKTKKHVKFTANIEHHDQKLRALRVRVICRKFAYKWIRFTYGRIRPSVARSHHYNKLLASCMKQWKEFWWTSCKEWKLIVRADYHSRRYWKNWCATYKTTVSNYHLNLIALHHWAEVLLKRKLTFDALRLYAVKKRLHRYRTIEADDFQAFKKSNQTADLESLETQQYVKAEAFFILKALPSEILQAKMFYKWLTLYHLNQDVKVMLESDLALSIRNHKALKQTFQHWRNSKNMLLASGFMDESFYCRKHRMELAIKRYRLRCISKCWKGWIKYTLERKRKYKEYFKANHHYSVALLSKTMDEWKSYNVLWGEINTKVADLAASKRILLLRDGFKQWRVAIRTIKELKAIETECNKIYHKNLLRKVLSNWYNYLSERTIEKQMQRTKLEEARIQLKASKLARIFSHWRISKNEIVKMRQKMEIVVNYDNRKCLRNAFMKWNKYVKLCFRKEAFKAWLGYTKYKKDKAARFSKATEMRQQYLLKTGIVAWLRIGDEIAQQKKLAVSKRESESLYRIYHVVYKFARHWMYVTFSKQPTVRNLSAIPVPPLLIEDEGTSSNEKLEVTESFPSLQYLRDKQVKRRRPRIPDYLHSEYSNASNETAAVRLAAVKNRKVARIPSHLGKNEALVRTLDAIDANILPRKTPQPLIKEIPVPVHDYLDPVELKTDRDQLSHKISDSSSYQYVNKDGAKNKGLPRAINPVKLKTDRDQLSRKKSDSSSYQFIDEGAENKNLPYEINPTEQKTYGNQLSQKTLDSSLYQFINKEGAENKSLQWEILQIKDELQDFERLKLEYNCCIESRRDILNRLEQETNDDRVIDLDGRLKQINMLLDIQKAKLECNRPRIQQLLSHIRTLLRQHSTS